MLSVLGHALRMGRAGFVLAREGAFVDLDTRLMPAFAVAAVPSLVGRLPTTT